MAAITNPHAFNNQVHVEDVDSSVNSVRFMQAAQSVPVFVRPQNHLILTSHDSADNNIEGGNGAQANVNTTP